MMDDLKWKFLEGQFLVDSISAALQRSGVYAPTATEKQGLSLRNELWNGLLSLAMQYSALVGEDRHIENIGELANQVTESCGTFLNGSHLRFGIAQKALNLFLKYLWCSGRVEMPPHCPFDSIVIGKLPAKARVPWTRIDSEAEYLQLVASARAIAGDEPLALWELRVYSGEGVPIPSPSKSTAAKAGDF